jgi:hypothetical protein
MVRGPGLGGEAGCSRAGKIVRVMGALRLKVSSCLLLSLMLAACSSQGAKKPTPEALLQAIPAADPAQYDHVRDYKKWRNPYLIVRADGVALFDSADSAEIILKPEEVIGALAHLPASNWPYGRVVAATEITHASDQEGVAIRRNKGLVGGLLEEAHVAIKWVPET